MNKDDIKLRASGKEISGWTDIRVHQGIQTFPNQFELSLTEAYPLEHALLRVEPGDYAEFRCGEDIMVAGYIDRYFTSMSGSNHSIQLSGRGKCMDLADASAEWPGGQFSNVTVKDLAENLVKPYGLNTRTGENHPIKVICTEEGLVRVPQLNLMIGESGYDIIDRVARYSQLMVFENAHGDLVLARAGTGKMASGFVEGENVEAASIQYSADRRFSEYTAFISSIWPSLDGGDGGNLIGGFGDVGVNRNRKRHIIAEATQGFQDLAMRRAIWEMNHRIGESEVIKITTDTWRDSAGSLWEPNKLVPVFLPSLKMKAPVNWLIVSVDFIKSGQSGTTAELVIMPREAFDVQPIALYQSNLIDTSQITF